MKYVFLILCSMSLASCVSDVPLSPPGDGKAHWIENTLAQMTLHQKAGEMTQLTLGVLLKGCDPFEPDEPQELDSLKVAEAVETYHIGSVLNCGNHAHSLEEWRNVVRGIQESAARRTPATPILYGVDAVHGANYTTGAVLSPQQIGLAATWNPDLVSELAAGTAHELHAAGTPWNFAPILDVGRDPRWPRFWETYGEDPYLVATMGAAAIKGMQNGAVPVASTMKHFLGYSMPLTGKDRTPAWIPERQLREIFLPPFQAGVDAGAMTVMVNSGEMNGIPLHANPWILTDLLRDEMGFEGVVVTDWEDIKYLVTRHMVAENYKDAIEMVILAGVDMSMVPLDLDFPVLLTELVEEGRITEERIDESVRRILGLKWDLGLVEDPGPPESHVVIESWRKDQQQLAQKAAEQSITLLKNNGKVLPLSRTENLWVTGPTSASLAAINGGWTGTWQGTDSAYDTPGATSALEAIRTEWLGAVNHFALDMNFQDDDIAEAVADLKTNRNVQAAVVFLGEMPYSEIVGNDEEVRLAENQSKLVQALCDTGVPVVGVYLGGRPRRMEEAVDALDAFIMGYLPGDWGGFAIARVLDGEVNPSGHLPFTWPRKSGSHLTYDHKHTEAVHTDFSLTAFRPLFHFGDGMNYSDVQVVEVLVEKASYSMEDSVKIRATIENPSTRDASDVIHLFSQDRVASVTPSVDRLRAFQRVDIPAGARTEVRFEVPVKQLGFIDRNLKYTVEPGAFGIRIANYSTTIQVNP